MSKQAILAVALVALVIAAFTLPIVDWLAAFFAWVQANPAIAWAVFIAFYVGAVVLMLPGSLLTLGAGYLFGLGYGFAIVSFASTVGATCASWWGASLPDSGWPANYLPCPASPH